MKTSTIVGLVITGIVVVIAIFCFGGLAETNVAGQLQVKQAAIWGTLSCKTEPGMYWQGFGDIHTYPEADTFYFTKDKETGAKRDQSLPTRFNDGAKSRISGSVRVIYPMTCPELTKLHRKFHSPKGVMTKLVLPAMRKALFNSGPHMSADESYAERRAEFSDLAEDQLLNGTIMVNKRSVKVTDPLTGKIKTVVRVEKRTCTEKSKRCIGGYYRSPSAFHEFGIDLTNFVIDEMTYQKVVKDQIELQRKARMDIITQQAQAKQAEARAKKATADAKAQIAETRAKEEVAKTRAIVQAEGKKKVAVLNAEQKKEEAKLDLDSARLEKQANIARGQGEAARRKAVMVADGALDKKLKAAIEMNKDKWNALSRASKGALVPTIVMGGSGGSSDPSTKFMRLLNSDAALNILKKLENSK